MFTTKWQPKVTARETTGMYIRSRRPASLSYLALTVAPHTWVVLVLRVQCHGDTTHTFVTLVIVISVHMCFISCKLLYVILFELPLFNKHMKLT